MLDMYQGMWLLGVRGTKFDAGVSGERGKFKLMVVLGLKVATGRWFDTKFPLMMSWVVSPVMPNIPMYTTLTLLSIFYNWYML